MIAKKNWANKHKETANGLWKIVKEIRGSRASNPFSHLRQQYSREIDMIDAFTHEIQKNCNSCPDVELMSIGDGYWDFSISEREVFHELLGLNIRKSCGPELIPPRLLKIGAHFLCEPLCNIFNRSIKTKTFPDCFKLAFVHPIPKTTRPTVKDFRPISLTPVVSKIFERLVLHNIGKKLISIYGTNQHAYRPLGSTTSALVAIHDGVTSFLDERRTAAVRMMCMDISKAFDRLHFNRLLNFLNVNGLDHGFLWWLKSYLSGRSFAVRIGGNNGSWVHVPSGVPQGSVLGPFLFAAYMSSIDFCSDSVRCVKYADDLTIVERIECASQQLLCNNHSKCVQQSLSSNSIIETFTSAGLSLNLSKCKEIIIQRSSLPENIVSTSVFNRVCAFRILGVTFCDSLSWKPQICDTVKRASQRLYIIRTLRDVLSTAELITVYHAIVTSMLLYASPAYGNLPRLLQEKLERFQRRAHRIICGRDCDCDRFRPISRLLKERGLHFLECCEREKSHPLHHMVPKRLEKSGHLLLCHSSTTRRLHSFFPWFCACANNITSFM